MYGRRKKDEPRYVNPRLLNLAGQIFGAWTVISYAGRNNNKQPSWNCKCSCGTERIVVGQTLRCGLTNSCGCQHSARITKAKTKHGGAIKKKREGDEQNRRSMNAEWRQEITYRRWLSMKKRVTDTSPQVWQYYGAKGITVCDRWKKFENFLEDMGKCPDGLSLDRIDPNGNYEPSNCRWATWSQQFRQRMMTEVCPTCNKLRQVCGSDRLEAAQTG